MHNTPPSSDYTQRHARLAVLLQNAGLHALVLNPGPTLTYLTGLQFHLMERPVVFWFAPHTPPIAVLPELEAGKTASLPFPVQVFPYGEDPQTWSSVFQQAARTAEIMEGPVGIEPRALRVLELRLLELASPEVDFIDAGDSLAYLRMRKDEREAEAMRKAVEIAENAFKVTLDFIRPGVSEQEIAAELTIQLLRAGTSSPLPFDPIVSSGPNSANPHAVPGSRVLEQGDLLVIDWGANSDGYISDLTRTLAIGKVTPELDRIAAVVADANAAGRSAARPGIPAGDVDRAARSVIESAGYGKYFIHRTGHGIGMEGHEAPYIYAQNELVLEPGMAFTVEPGIYLPGTGGVRIEDNILINDHGAETLSTLPRELLSL